jgi:glc operon protein GlcG
MHMAFPLDLAQKLIGLALEKGRRDFARPIVVAVCDENGFLVALARQENAPLRSIQISQSKAYTAVRMGMNTAALLAKLQKENLSLAYYCDPNMTAMPGGTLLKRTDGTILGAIGISGLAPHEDVAVTEYVAGLLAAGEIR